MTLNSYVVNDVKCEICNYTTLHMRVFFITGVITPLRLIILKESCHLHVNSSIIQNHHVTITHHRSKNFIYLKKLSRIFKLLPFLIIKLRATLTQ